MKKITPRKPTFSFSRLLACLLCLISPFLALLAISGSFGTKSFAQGAASTNVGSVWVGASYHNDVSPPLREMPTWNESDLRRGVEREANENPKIPYRHVDSFDPVVQNWDASVFAGKGPNIPVPISTFDGIPYPGVGCSCAPPDPNGAVGLTQYVQIVNEAYQVFDRPQAIQFWDLIAFLPSGVVLAVYAKTTVAVIQSCSTIIWPTAGS